MAKYADIIVPVPIPGEFTYLIPHEETDVGPMYRVAVPFGRGKFYTGIVTNVHNRFTEKYELKAIAWVPDKYPILRIPQLKLWEWIASYYMCAVGDVFKAALPSGLKIESETYVELNPDYDVEEIASLSPKQQTLLTFINEKEITTVKELQRNGFSDAMSQIYKLMDIGAVNVHEKLSERFRPKKEEYYELLIDRNDPQILNNVFMGMRSPRQQRLLMKMLQLSDFTKQGAQLKSVSRSAIQHEDFYDRAVLRALEKKGLIRIQMKEVSRFKWDGGNVSPLPILSDAQQQALNLIHSGFRDRQTVLLHGVTASGKTEIYIHLIDFVLKQNKQVLYLVPEIALTTQLTTRLQSVFGNKVIIYHSRFSDSERSEIWLRLLRTNDPFVIIGARSSVFLPFAQLGLVIVDEEHEQSYKQFDPAPRYNARDVATVLARLHGAKTLLASATPSIETYYKAQTGKYGLVTLSERYSGINLPDIEIVDMSKARLQKQTKHSFAHYTLEACREALDRKEQLILFNNRRGYSPIAHCRGCEFVPKCQDCDVSLTFHKGINKLQCHYCGREYEMPLLCPVCQQPTMEVSGYGTERVEDNIAEAFPNAGILRMDLDTTRNKENYADIIDRFSARKADILVGTQMVTKGLDFAGVSTVVVLNADAVINYPDFRATERAFNMLEQVAGRAGRRSDVKGRVLIQTSNPGHPVIQFAGEHDYESFYKHELDERRNFSYPPFTRIIYIIIRNKDSAKCVETAQALALLLKRQLGNRVSDPQEPGVNRIKTYYLRRIMVKIENAVSVGHIKEILLNSVHSLKQKAEFKSSDIYFDVDP